jgi:uncharacterized membrane protein
LHTVLLVLSTFAASAVEMVEALTIILAVGVTRGWRPVVVGTTGAVVALGGVVALLGPAVNRIPLNSLRLVVGGLLLIFGLQWLRKAILRASGLKSLHDEEAIYEEELRRLRAAGGGQGRTDWYGVTVAFKGVFLEGLEVVFIVLTFGATQGHVGAAALAAVSALLVVAVVGIAVHKPLTRVPENTLKFLVGIMLTSFGLFWSAEGAGAHWPGNDLFILVVIAITTAVACSTVATLRAAGTASVRTPN